MENKSVVNLGELELQTKKWADHYHFEWLDLSAKMGAQKLGFNVSKIQPGDFSCPYHFHHSEEELFLVLEGSAILRLNGKFRRVKKGDLIFCTTGLEGAHQFYNHTKEPFVYLALSTLDPLEIGEYPDSKKINISKLKKIFQNGAEVNYLKGEEDPAKYWPEKWLKPNPDTLNE